MATINISSQAIERAFEQSEHFWQRALDLELEKGSAAEREERSRRDYDRRPRAQAEG
jgi:hypothetical protein